MKTIKILGTGCVKCKRTEENVRIAVAELALDVEIVKVEDIQAIMQYDILTTPAVVVDEVVKIKGHVPGVQEIKNLLQPEYTVGL